MKHSVFLYNIRSVHNVGSILRTADGAGFDHVYFYGYTPQPVDRFGRRRNDMQKVSLGAEQSLSWSVIEDLEHFFHEKKDEHIMALEQDERSLPYANYEEHTNASEHILMVGEEVEGFPKEILDMVDTIYEIPMRGDKESLNVAVSFGIMAYEMTKKHHN